MAHHEESARGSSWLIPTILGERPSSRYPGLLPHKTVLIVRNVISSSIYAPKLHVIFEYRGQTVWPEDGLKSIERIYNSCHQEDKQLTDAMTLYSGSMNEWMGGSEHTAGGSDLPGKSHFNHVLETTALWKSQRFKEGTECFPSWDHLYSWTDK